MLRQAERKRAKIKMAVCGPAGSGKTYSSLLTAFGLVGDWKKIAVICTEPSANDGRAADLFSHLGPYNVLPLDAPYRPERYIDAIRACEKAGMEAIIIDSISHEWEGEGGLVEDSNKMDDKNKFSNWDVLGRRHKKLINAILLSPAHVIACARTKTDYVLEANEKGKMAPRKVGTKVITREGFDFEVTLAFDLSYNHFATCSKDRTDMYADCEPFRMSAETGKQILEWCNSGKAEEIAQEQEAEAIQPVETKESLKQVLETERADRSLTWAEVFTKTGITLTKESTLGELQETLNRLIAS